MLPMELAEKTECHPRAAGGCFSIYSLNNSLLISHYVPAVGIRNTEIKNIMTFHKFSSSTKEANKIS